MEDFDIVIIDDDPMTGELTKDLLVDAGWKVLLIDDSTKAIEQIKKIMPRLVITDIMMPGINGMEICKMLKSNPETKGIKVVILSGKSYESEKQRAMMLGADFFMAKPYNVETFSKAVKEIIDNTKKIKPPPPPVISKKNISIRNIKPDLAENQIRLTAYGIRSLGKKLPESSSRYGRQTLCFSIETKDDILICDAGSGLYDAGNDIKTKKPYKNIWLLLTHFHLDNLIGLPHFLPLLDSSYTINIVGPNDPERSLKDVIKTNLYSSFSPISAKPMAKINIYEVLEENYKLSTNIKMATMYSNHPTTTMTYLLNINGFRIAYSPDSEIWEESTAFQDYNERFGKFTSGFDVLIHDSYYNDKDYESNNHKGHSSISVLTKFVTRNRIKKIIPININSEYDDKEIDDMEKVAMDIIKKLKSTSTVTFMKEGDQKIFETKKIADKN